MKRVTLRYNTKEIEYEQQKNIQQEFEFCNSKHTSSNNKSTTKDGAYTMLLELVCSWK